MTSDIVQTAVEAGSFQTLVAAVTAAGLTETLQGKGPFTVFAPTDAAFAKLPAGAIQGLLADKARLTSLLTYHVVPGRVLAADVVKVRSAKSVQGGDLTVSAENGTVSIDEAKVVQTDVLASNGVIHAIDTVLSPR
ncbi:MAG: fasciclin domain-containing protein [Acidobacteriota bacterium]